MGECDDENHEVDVQGRPQRSSDQIQGMDLEEDDDGQFQKPARQHALLAQRQ